MRYYCKCGHYFSSVKHLREHVGILNLHWPRRSPDDEHGQVTEAEWNENGYGHLSYSKETDMTQSWTVIYRVGDRRHYAWRKTRPFTEAQMAQGYAKILEAQGTPARAVDTEMCEAVGLPEGYDGD